MSSYLVTGNILGAGDIALNKMGKNPCPCGSYVIVGVERYQKHKVCGTAEKHKKRHKARKRDRRVCMGGML